MKQYSSSSSSPCKYYIYIYIQFIAILFNQQSQVIPQIKETSILNMDQEMANISSSNNKATNEIVFFDLETNVPRKPGQKFWILEFGAIVVCPRKLVELESYCTLIRPGDLTAIGLKSGRVDGITRGEVAKAPSFEEVADRIFEVLDGRVWAGHNIQRFDCVRIRAAFAEIGRPAPKPIGMIDSLWVLSEKFGRRAGNMKMASLADYFGLGEQTHRSLDDVRMNLEVVKHCATVLFLESSLPDILSGKWQNFLSITTRSRSTLVDSSTPSTFNNQWRSSPTMTTRSKSDGKIMCREESNRKSPSISLGHQRASPYPRGSLGKMTEGFKNILYKAQSQPFNNLLKHSHSLLR